MTTEELSFKITKDKLETGLRGFPVGYCVTSSVDPVQGLFYGGIPVADLSSRRPEGVIYLLMHGKEGNASEIQRFAESLYERSKLSSKVIEAIERVPREGHPMKLLSIAILITGMLEGTGDYHEDCLNLIARLPEIVARVINHHAGWQIQNPSSPELGYMENFVQMLGVPGIDQTILSEVMNVFNVLHYDHGGGNLSTFVGKATASGDEDLYGSISSAMCALAGPKHGKANQDCLQFVKMVLSELGEDATNEEVRHLIEKRIENKKLVYGFGHAVLRVEDPRATVFYAMAEQRWSEHPYVKIASLLRSEVPTVLKQYPKIANPYPNVDAISGTVLTAAGFSFPEYYTVLFGLARSVGISIQIVYERLQARDGKGTPIIRPKYLYRPRSS